MRTTTTKPGSSNHTNSMHRLAETTNRVKEFLADNSEAIRERVTEGYDNARDQARAKLRESRRRGVPAWPPGRCTEV